MSGKYQVKLLSVKQTPTHTCHLCCSESLTEDCDSLAEKTSSPVRPHDLARKTEYSNYELIPVFSTNSFKRNSIFSETIKKHHE